jgi:hypothetical protein
MKKKVQEFWGFFFFHWRLEHMKVVSRRNWTFSNVNFGETKQFINYSRYVSDTNPRRIRNLLRDPLRKSMRNWNRLLSHLVRAIGRLSNSITKNVLTKCVLCSSRFQQNSMDLKTKPAANELGELLNPHDYFTSARRNKSINNHERIIGRSIGSHYSIMAPL